MTLLHLPPTEKTPEVILEEDNRLFQIKGNCLPENIRDFSQMVTEKIESYLNALDNEKKIDAGKAFKVNFKLGYFNTAAAKFIVDVLMVLKTHLLKGSPIKIYWHYHEDDYDMLEAGEDMGKMVDVPMTYVMVEKQGNYEK